MTKADGCKFTAETARAALEAIGGSILFEKVLTSSDASGTGRLVIPKSQAEAHFPYLESQQGMILPLTDTDGKKHAFRFRFWINNQSRMYLLENTSEVQGKYRMQAGDVLVFAKLPDGSYAVCGRKGTKDDVSRKPAVRRQPPQQVQQAAQHQPTASGGAGTAAAPTAAPAAAPADTSPAGVFGGGGTEGGGGSGSGGAANSSKAAGKRGRSRGGASQTLKSKRIKQKQATQAVQSLFSYWAATSIPMKRDGVFRAVPNSALQEGDKVVAQFGAWSAIVNVGGELFQAFFDTQEAANAAFEAAMQSYGKSVEDTTPAAAGAPVAADAPAANTRRTNVGGSAAATAAAARLPAGDHGAACAAPPPAGQSPADTDVTITAPAVAEPAAPAAEPQLEKQQLQQRATVLPLLT